MAQDHGGLAGQQQSGRHQAEKAVQKNILGRNFHSLLPHGFQIQALACDVGRRFVLRLYLAETLGIACRRRDLLGGAFGAREFRNVDRRREAGQPSIEKG